MNSEDLHPSDDPNDLFIFELEERLEFGAALIDSDLDADDNSGCSNAYACYKYSNTSCVNGNC